MMDGKIKWGDNEVADITEVTVTFDNMDCEKPYATVSAGAFEFSGEVKIDSSMIKFLEPFVKPRFDIEVMSSIPRDDFPSLIRSLSRWICKGLKIKSGWLYDFGWSKQTLIVKNAEIEVDFKEVCE